MKSCRLVPVLLVFALLVGACDRAPPSSGEVASAEAVPETSPPSASTVVSALPVASASAPAQRASTTVAGRVLEIQRGDAPSVRIAAERGDLVIKGVDGEMLGWRRGDRVVVDADKRSADSIDCYDASTCSVGLESGGDIVLAGIDAHVGASLLGLMKKRVVIAGPSRRAAVEIRASNDDLLFRSFAAAMGLGIKRYRMLTLFAQPKLISEARIKRVQPKSRIADLSLMHVALPTLGHFLGEVVKTPISGQIEGEVSVGAAGVDAADVLDAAFGACGVTYKKNKGALDLVDSGSACRQKSPERRCTRREEKQQAIHQSLHCIAPERLRVLAVAIPPKGRPMAVLGEGDPVGDEVAAFEGDYLGQAEKISTSKGDVEVNWRISHIAHDHVELYFGVDPNVGINVKERRIRAPIATSAEP